MEDQSKQTSSEDVEAHQRKALVEEPGSPDEHGKRNLVDDGDEDVEAHQRKALVEDPGSPDEHGKRNRSDDDDVEAHIKGR